MQTTTKSHLPLPADTDPIRDGAKHIRAISQYIEDHPAPRPQAAPPAPLIYRRSGISVNYSANKTDYWTMGFPELPAIPAAIACVNTRSAAHIYAEVSDLTTSGAKINVYSPSAYRGNIDLILYIIPATQITERN